MLFKHISNAAASIDPLAGFYVMMQVRLVPRYPCHLTVIDWEAEGDQRFGTIRGDGGWS